MSGHCGQMVGQLFNQLAYRILRRNMRYKLSMLQTVSPIRL
jgi:hypothetical protein